MYTPSLPRARRIGPLLTALTMSLGLYAVPAHAAVSSPASRVLVVTANLREAYGNHDASNHRDMRVFLKRLTARVPYAPDVLLLQEVRHSSARWVARHLGDRTGHPYRIKVDPGKRPTHTSGSFTRFKDTAILFNKDTMSGRGDGRYFSTRPTWSEVPNHSRPRIMQHAMTAGTERATGMKLSFASLHLSPPGTLKSSAQRSVRDRWVNGIADSMSDHYSNTRRSVGGDFNSSRCKYGGGQGCPLSPFWASMTRDRNYRDGLRQVMVQGGVDFVFTKAGVYRAGLDEGYNPKAAQGDPSRFYSDHRFRWVVLGPDTKDPSKPGQFVARGRRPDVALDWARSSDQGDSGVAGYEIWRAGKKGDFRLKDSVPASQTSFVDRSTYYTLVYRYRIAAVDGAHNVSSKSDIRRVTP